MHQLNIVCVRPQNVLRLEAWAAVCTTHIASTLYNVWVKQRLMVVAISCLYYLLLFIKKQNVKHNLGSFFFFFGPTLSLGTQHPSHRFQPQIQSPAPVSAEWASETRLMNNVIISVLHPEYLSESHPPPQPSNPVRSAVRTQKLCHINKCRYRLCKLFLHAHLSDKPEMLRRYNFGSLPNN